MHSTCRRLPAQCRRFGGRSGYTPYKAQRRLRIYIYIYIYIATATWFVSTLPWSRMDRTKSSTRIGGIVDDALATSGSHPWVAEWNARTASCPTPGWRTRHPPGFSIVVVRPFGHTYGSDRAKNLVAMTMRIAAVTAIVIPSQVPMPNPTCTVKVFCSFQLRHGDHSR